ncbi:family 20 glycosylhydrolase [uncultured Sphingomonas sp.]|uniref:family 20 glycosylhydrolase n=1 Tax=uncultured Sphingomonas sp. TaxID=158754 RepID=UPI0030F7ECEA
MGPPVCRQRIEFAVGDVLRIGEQMAAPKLHILRLQPCDDEGWRMEIPEPPELTQLGADPARCRRKRH